jgi:UDP-N-acetylmuramyl pentapeptide synthase
MPDDRRIHVADHQQAVQTIRQKAGDLDTVLVKGSRGMHMDKVVVSLIEEGGEIDAV